METRTSKFLLDRQIQEVSEAKGSALGLSVLTWNVLARNYSTPKHYPYLENDVKDMDARKPLLSEEIVRFSPDIICLQEVDKTDTGFYSSIFPEGEYSFNYVKKAASADGSCILLRKKAFEVVETEIIEHIDPDKGKKGSLVSLVVVAKYIEKELPFYVITATTHFKADWITSFSHIRVSQAKEILQVIEKKRDKCVDLLGENKGNLAVIVCGDFNDVPSSLATQEFLNHKELALKNPFSDVPFTLYQKFGDNLAKSTYDYILHTDNLKVMKTISPPNPEKLRDDGLLSREYPSDHLSLYCELAFMS
mmetsp:Transcript_61652/g.71735  ORF Transcript_61652/g.71735 Transcript_61652/m.71735 type:complete len:307 (-) Transcript_61652:129-1049(-)